MLRMLAPFLLLFGLLPSAAASAPTVLSFDTAQTSFDRSVTPPEHFVGDETRLPDDWTADIAGGSGQRWYRIVFDDPGSVLPVIYIERVCTNAEVWVNATLVGSGGQMTEPMTRNCYYPQLFRIPPNLLTARGNHLDIRVAGFPLSHVSARQRAGGLARVQMGPELELRKVYEQRYFWNITIAQVIGASMILLGILMLALGAVRRQDRHFLYFGLLLIFWSGLGARLYWQNIPWPVLQTEILITSLFPPVVLVALQFLLHYVRQPRRWVTTTLMIQCGAVPLALFLVPPDQMFPVASAIYTVLAGELLVAVVYFIWRSWSVMRHDFWLIGGVHVLALVLVAYEIFVQNDWLPLPKIHLIHFAMPLIFLGIGIRLVQQFAAALSHSEQLNREFEQRVAEESVQIERNFARLGELRRMQAVSEERLRIASDLHDDLGARLLTITQVSLYANDMGRVAALARQALDDMRLSVRGLTGSPAPVPEVLADWRAETVERLTLAGFVVHWDANEPSMQWLLPARTQVQLTRILREAISNVIRHSGASECWIEVHVAADELRLCVEDNGCGLKPDRATQGQGLPGIERRARALAGVLEIGARENNGMRVRLRIPLPAMVSENIAEPE